MNNITYTSPEVSDIGDEVNQVNVVYTTESGSIFKRKINVPRKEDGSVDEDLYNESLESHLKSVKYKIKVGAIRFIDQET